MSRSVKIASGKSRVELPNGFAYDAGALVTLTDAQFALIPASLIPATIIDLGESDEVLQAKVKVAAGKTNVQLPNGQVGKAGDEYFLTDAQIALVPAALFPGTLINEDDKLVFFDIPVKLADLVNNAVYKTFKPGWAGKILDVDFITTVPVTTSAKAATLGLLINPVHGGEISGGAVAVTSSNATPAGAEVAGSAVVGNVNEVQTITLANATGGTFTVTYAGQTTTALAYNISAADLQTALIALSNLAPGDVVVTGSDGGPYTLTFGGTLAATDVAQVTCSGTLLLGTNEVQRLTVDATSGTFTVTFGGQTIPAQQFNVSAVNLQAALRLLSSINGANVTVTGGPGNSGGTTPYTITFIASLGSQNVAQVTAASVDLAGGGAAVTPSTLTPGVAPTVTPGTGTAGTKSTFTADDSFDVKATSVTTFIEGEGILRVTILKT